MTAVAHSFPSTLLSRGLIVFETNHERSNLLAKSIKREISEIISVFALSCPSTCQKILKLTLQIFTQHSGYFLFGEEGNVLAGSSVNKNKEHCRKQIVTGISG